MNLKGRSFLKLLDYTKEEIEYLLDLSIDLKNKKKNKYKKKSKKLMVLWLKKECH